LMVSGEPRSITSSEGRTLDEIIAEINNWPGVTAVLETADGEYAVLELSTEATGAEASFEVMDAVPGDDRFTWQVFTESVNCSGPEEGLVTGVDGQPGKLEISVPEVTSLDDELASTV